MLMRTKSVDFHYIEPGHKDIDAKLRNWSAWVTPRAPSWVSPTWRMARSNARQWHQPEIRPTCDVLGALAMEKAVSKLPEPFRTAIRWHYVTPVSPTKACKVLGLTMDGLGKAVRDARQMLINRGM